MTAAPCAVHRWCTGSHVRVRAGVSHVGTFARGARDERRDEVVVGVMAAGDEDPAVVVETIGEVLDGEPISGEVLVLDPPEAEVVARALRTAARAGRHRPGRLGASWSMRPGAAGRSSAVGAAVRRLAARWRR